MIQKGKLEPRLNAYVLSEGGHHHGARASARMPLSFPLGRVQTISGQTAVDFQHFFRQIEEFSGRTGEAQVDLWLVSEELCSRLRGKPARKKSSARAPKTTREGACAPRFRSAQCLLQFQILCLELSAFFLGGKSLLTARDFSCLQNPRCQHCQPGCQISGRRSFWQAIQILQVPAKNQFIAVPLATAAAVAHPIRRPAVV